MVIKHEDFIKYCNMLHSNKYDYSNTTYTGIKNNILVNCPSHGSFTLIADRHKRGDGCPDCSKQKRILSKTKNTDDFISRCKIVHNNYYDYTKTIYEKAKKKITITCPIHGDFTQLACNHVGGQGCPYCGECNISKAKMKSHDLLLNQFHNIHGSLYSYENIDYKGAHINVAITCRNHGIFYQTPDAHINQKRGCPKCAVDKNRKSYDQFVCDAVSVHGSKYSYINSVYVNKNTKIEILCSKHGPFYQAPGNHLSLKQGCPRCVSSWYSKTENDWLTFMGVPEGQTYRNVYIKLTDGYVRVDGFYNDVVYEFWGDFWHGNPIIYPSGIHPIINIEYKVLYQKTLEKIKRIKENGYQLIDIWENDWRESQS